jgi:hypothetical protein
MWWPRLPAVADPIFSPVPGTFPPPSDAAVAADRQATLGNDPEAYFSLARNPELKELAYVLAPDPAHPAKKPILDDPRPLAAMSSLIEDFLLEYTDGKPMAGSWLGARGQSRAAPPDAAVCEGI